MSDNKYEIQDLINSSVEQKPVDFNDIFGSLMVDRLNAAIDNKKMEIAKSMFDAPEEDFESDEEEYSELNSEEEIDGETA
jgi:hypothetical protein